MRSLTPRNLCLLILAAALLSCAKRPAVEIESVSLPTRLRPHDIIATPKDKACLVFWKIDRLPNVPIHGYDIQLSESPNGPWNSYQINPYPGDTDGDIFRESIELQNLKNGATYYLRIITVISDDLASEPSAICSFTPYESGTAEISTDLNSENSGFCFSQKRNLPAKDYANDIYFFYNKRKKGLSSPSLLHPHLKKTLIARGDIESDNQGAFAQSQPLDTSAIYTIKTAEGARVKLSILKISEGPKGTTIKIGYDYHPAATGGQN